MSKTNMIFYDEIPEAMHKRIDSYDPLTKEMAIAIYHIHGKNDNENIIEGMSNKKIWERYIEQAELYKNLFEAVYRVAISDHNRK